MHLVPKEVSCLRAVHMLHELGADLLCPQLDKLLTSQLGFLAQRRLARGVQLNHAEATVCLTWQLIIFVMYLMV